MSNNSQFWIDPVSGLDTRTAAYEGYARLNRERAAREYRLHQENLRRRSTMKRYRNGQPASNRVNPVQLVNAAANVMRAIGSRSRTQRSGSASLPITAQRDFNVIYRRKRAPWKVKRRAKRYRKFCKKVINAVDTRNEKQKVLFVQNGVLNSIAGTQACYSNTFQLYSVNISTTAGQRDMANMISGLGDTSTSETKTYFRSGQMEVVLQNKGTGAAYVDLYYYVARKDSGEPVTTQALVDQGFTGSPTNMGGSNLLSGTYGATVFQSKDFCQVFKIYRKTSALVPSGQFFEFNLRSSKNKIIDRDDIIRSPGALKGLTQGVVMIIYGAPNTTDGAPVATEFTYNVTRTYTLTNPRPGLVDSGAGVLAA